MSRTKYFSNNSRDIDLEKTEAIAVFKSRLGNWPIAIGDTYGVYTVVDIKADLNKPTNVNYATISLLCSVCGSIIFKNYNTMKRQIRAGKLEECKCFTIPKKDDKIKDSPVFKKIAQNIYEARQRFKGYDGFVSDPPRKIFESMSEDEINAIDLSDTRFTYWISTKDGTLRYIVGNVCFRRVLSTQFINTAESKIYVDPLYTDKRHALRNFLNRSIKSDNSELDSNGYIRYKKSKFSHRLKIGSVIGNLKVIDYIKGDGTHYNRAVCECQKCGFVFARLPKRFLFEKNLSCPHCNAGVKKSYNKRNSAFSISKREKILRKMELASIECMSDYSRYYASGSELIDLKMDALYGSEYSFCDFLDVFGEV